MKGSGFLKWAGSKRRQVDRINAMLPGGTRLIEPFAGSAALSMALEFDSYLLADTNEGLINCFQQLQTHGQDFIELAEVYFQPKYNCEEAFYELREVFNTTSDQLDRGALFVYLNRHCFNGLCRFNRAGGFNSPFGSYAKPYFPRDEMVAFYEKSSRFHIVQQSFSQTMWGLFPGDVVYCDPPYMPLNEDGFTTFSGVPFGMREHLELRDDARTCARRGVPVVISNHATIETLEWYADADELIVFDVQRNISSDGATRGKVMEVLVRYGEV